jgi:hypothetical protein
MQSDTPPIVPDPEKQTRNNTPIIIAIVVVVLLCCCCLITVPVIRWLWFNGDSIFNVGLILRTIL